MVTLEIVITLIIIEKVVLGIIVYNSCTKEKIKTNEINLNKIENITYLDCPICFEEFNDEDNITILECGHYYHSNCIKEWINTKQLDKNNRKIPKTCPLCREPLVIVSNKQTD